MCNLGSITGILYKHVTYFETFLIIWNSQKYSILKHSSFLFCRLEVLYLGGNKITDIPAEIGQLHKLTALNLCDNEIQSLPPTMIHLRKLRSLSLHNNHLSTLPTEIVSLNLSELSLRKNPLVNKFVQDMVYEPPSLLELAGRIVKIERIKYSKTDLPQNLIKYLHSAQSCVNPKCRGRHKIWYHVQVSNYSTVVDEPKISVS